MQCVLLAAGEGSRMRPLTLETPKPLLRVCGQPILWHIVHALPSLVDEIIIVIGYKGEMIQEYCGDTFLGRKVTYVEQANPKGGTADAVFQTRDLITEKFLIMYGDDIHGSRALQEVADLPHGMLAAYSHTPEKFGVLNTAEDGTLISIVEKPENPPSNLVNIGGFVVTPEIFAFKPGLSVHGEYLLTDSVTSYAEKYPLKVVVQDQWISIGYPEDISKAEGILCA